MEILIGLKCGNDCNCEKQITYYSNSGVIIEKKYYCRTALLRVESVPMTIKDICYALEQHAISYQTNDLVEVICNEDNFYLQIPQPFYEQCEKEIKRYIGNIPQSIHELLISNIKDDFATDNIRIVRSWNKQNAEEIVNEVIADVLNRYDELVTAKV
ncbi:hypothetical protein [Bacillus sp. OK048]|uniref:hypothetical protein n=1 Tax=Bacillus sp. OK048 TaxID=1882761 RepID=UPI0008869FE7|nr:hypothetical protein [Bacillus sp. OK048]SDN63029.1 hypothetical protein SAMN05443253_11549 [Bacillus sp. OK048]